MEEGDLGVMLPQCVLYLHFHTYHFSFLSVVKKRAKNRRSSFTPDAETSLKLQLDERSQTIQKLQTEIASKNIAMENLRQGVDNRVTEKIRELEDVLKERDNIDEERRRLDQQKLALEIKLEEQRYLKQAHSQLREENMAVP